jgi:nicotinamidase-related amidase
VIKGTLYVSNGALVLESVRKAEGGGRIIPVLNCWIEAAVVAGIPIYLSRDWHPTNHVSFLAEGGEEALRKMKKAGAAFISGSPSPVGKQCASG